MYFPDIFQICGPNIQNIASFLNQRRYAFASIESQGGNQKNYIKFPREEFSGFRGLDTKNKKLSPV